jgi:Ca2+-binding EF-hand superfamily protein
MAQQIVERFAATAKRYGFNPTQPFTELGRAPRYLNGYSHGYFEGPTKGDSDSSFNFYLNDYLTPTAFIQALKSARVHITHAEAQLLQSAYMEDGRVNYRRFLHDVTNPPPPPPSAPRPPTDLTALIDFGLKLNAEGLSLSDVLAPHDRYRVGRVSFNTFLQAFGLAQSVQDLARQYSDASTNDVNYFELQSDITKALEQRAAAQKLANPLPSFFEDFVRRVTARGVNFQDAFVPLDRYRRGSVPVQSFLSVISSWGVDLTPTQLQELADPFVSQGAVNYPFFVRTILELAETLETSPISGTDAAETDLDSLLADIKARVATRRVRLRQQLEAESDGGISRTKFYKVLGFCGFTLPLCDVKAIDNAFLRPDDVMDVQEFLAKVDPVEPKAPQVDVNDLHYRLNSHLRGRRLSMWPQFESFDREKSGVVSVAQLISTFNAIDFHPTRRELNVLSQRYGNGRMIQYADLCNAVEPKPDILVRQTTAPVEKDEPTALVLGLLQRVFQNAKRCGVNVRRELQRADVRKSGLLAARVFKGVLDSLPVKLGHLEITVALKPYFKAGTEMVCYGEFCDDLEKYGSAPEPPALPATQIEKSAEVPERSSPALRFFKAALLSRRLAVEELFIGHDGGRTGTVPNDVVEPCCRPLAGFVTADVIREIAESFRDRRQPEKFNYRRLAVALSGWRGCRETPAAARPARSPLESDR